MKKLFIIALFTLTATFAQAAQQILIVPCSNGQAQIAQLAEMLKAGWRVIAATPVTDSDSFSIGKPKQSYTSSIVYIIEKP